MSGWSGTGDESGGEPADVARPTAPEPAPDVVDDPPEPSPGVVDLVTRSARLGVDVVGLVAGELASASARLARSVLPPAVAEKPLETVGEKVDRRVETARQREEVSREDALEAVQAVVNQTVGAVLDMIDWDMPVSYTHLTLPTKA